ncbi:hypothetical protein IAQ61_000735, partial [Plenodomus lingam]|uniref:Uncharacterized protein n=1 Tax=Leptosphaeria maculans (strain JN3 / isolate v23.1.3 / race Av1-4-5-6-7-8) TaxID=985895 RepID=E5A695_LEPMJ
MFTIFIPSNQLASGCHLLTSAIFPYASIGTHIAKLSAQHPFDLSIRSIRLHNHSRSDIRTASGILLESMIGRPFSGFCPQREGGAAPAGISAASIIYVTEPLAALLSSDRCKAASGTVPHWLHFSEQRSATTCLVHTAAEARGINQIALISITSPNKRRCTNEEEPKPRHLPPQPRFLSAP